MNKGHEEQLNAIEIEINAAEERVNKYSEKLLEIKIGLKKESEILEELNKRKLAIGNSNKPQ